MKNEFFKKILKIPLIVILGVSLWPLLTYFIPATFVPYLTFFYVLQTILILNYIRLFIIYLRYLKFPNYEEARVYFFDLRRVKKLELKAKIASMKKAKEEQKLKIQKENEEKRVREEKLKEEALKKLKLELEERKKKVL
jgi:hypothetical protein